MSPPEIKAREPPTTPKHTVMCKIRPEQHKNKQNPVRNAQLVWEPITTTSSYPVMWVMHPAGTIRVSKPVKINQQEGSSPIQWPLLTSASPAGDRCLGGCTGNRSKPPITSKHTAIQTVLCTLRLTPSTVIWRSGVVYGFDRQKLILRRNLRWF
jgi:hypothetical protein